MRELKRKLGLAGVRRGSVRARGLIAAAVLLLGFGGFVAFMAMRQRAAAAAPAPLFDTTLTPDITKISPNSGGSMASGLVQGSAMNVQLVDDKDPSRVQAEISAERSQPLAGSEFSLTKPKARIFLRDGRTMLVDADKGRARMPQGVTGGRPQDGLLEGNVLIRLFPETKGHVIGANDKPLLTMKAPLLKFDATLGRIEFPANVTAKGDQLDFEGDGLIVLYDEAKKRIDGVHLDHLARLVLLPGTREAKKAAPQQTGAVPATGGGTIAAGGAEAPVKAAVPVESLYRMVARDHVSVKQGPKSITSDEVLAWLRLVDGKLRPAAVASLAPLGAEPVAMRSAGSSGAIRLAAFQPVGDAVKLPTPPKPAPVDANDQPIEIHWSGPMDAALESSTPGELNRNDVFARFTSGMPLGVIAKDEVARATAKGSMIEYGATVREATVAGPGSSGAILEADERGDARGSRFEIAMATGRIRSPGEGVIHGKPAKPNEPEAPRGSIAWKSDAEFQLAMERGVMQARPVSAKLTGGVEANDGLAMVSAESLDATFFPGSSALKHVLMVGNAAATDGKAGTDAGRLSADTLDLAFEALPGGQSRASRIDLNGRANAEQREQHLAASRIIADLEPAPNGRTEVAALVARDQVAYTGKGGTTITGDKLNATPSDDWAEVTSSAPDGVTMCQGLSTIRTSRVQFDGRGKLVHVPAPGTLWHQKVGEGEVGSVLKLTWADRLDYDDAAGVGRCDGATVAVLTKPGVSRDVLVSDSAEIHLASGGDQNKRTLDTAVAIGTDARPARVESKRFGPDGMVVDQAMVVEGARIAVDETHGVFEVPTAGKMLLADRRAPAEPTSAATEATPPAMALRPTSSRGDTLVSWTGTMKYDRAEGRIHATDGVRAIHVVDQESMQLDCDDLLAFVSTQASEVNGTLVQAGQLKSALATGRAWLRTRRKDGAQSRELSAGQVAYDAVTTVAQADASIGGPVTISDSKTGAPVKARRIVWNLKGDRVEADGVQQFAAPK
ncbi:MAG: hypothetical protein WC718_14015 [Phycisphaerales bacterium]|jgi:hypothetical protein